MVFINYNYDYVLDDNFLNFEHVSAKDRLRNNTHLDSLAYSSVRTFCPHGTLFPKYEKRPSHIQKYFKTLKTDSQDLLDAISCYEDYYHTVKASNFNHSLRKIYILGLGRGLEINFEKINFTFPVSEIYVTIRNQALNGERIVSFLSKKFKIPPENIKVYNDCKKLIEEMS